MPLLVDADDVSHFFSLGDLDGLHWALSETFALGHRVLGGEGGRAVPPSVVARGGGSSYSAAYKLRMDKEAALHIARVSEDEGVRRLFREEVAPALGRALERVPRVEELGGTGGLYSFKGEDYADGIGEFYNRALVNPEVDELRVGPGIEGLAALSPDLDAEGIQRRWEESERKVIVVDDLLSKEALSAVRGILLNSTLFYETKMPAKFGEYSGAYIDDGLHQRLVLAIAFELAHKLPRVFESHPLRYLWAYKYGSERGTGINLHADQAAINVNIWLAPDEANLDPESGGLVVFTARPPKGSDFSSYNTDVGRLKEELLRPTGFENVTVPHRCNRAVIVRDRGGRVIRVRWSWGWREHWGWRVR